MMRSKNVRKQVMRGHSIVLDGWAGASNPHPNPQHTHKHIQIVIHLFFNFSTQTLPTDGQTDGQMDRQMDGQSPLYSCLSATKKTPRYSCYIFEPTSSNFSAFIDVISGRSCGSSTCSTFSTVVTRIQ